VFESIFKKINTSGPFIIIRIKRSSIELRRFGNEKKQSVRDLTSKRKKILLKTEYAKGLS
jgi:hypothetical protein